jgi:4-hydroxy-tetrahydrodipicolinate synthase
VKTIAEIMGRVSIPLLTPFHDDGGVNYDALAELVDFVITKGHCDSVILTGTTGEFHTMDDTERHRVWKAGLQAAGSRVPMVAGVGAASTRSTLRHVRAAEEMGFDVAMCVLPYYAHPTQQGIEQHFRAVAGATSLPVLVYNLPLFTGVNMEPGTLQRLVRDVPNIRGIKDEAGIQPTQATAYALHTPPGVSIYCGDDTMVLQVLPQRGVGAVSGGSHVIGRHMKAMIAAYFDNDNQAASQIYFRLTPFFLSLCQNNRVNPVPILRGACEMVSGIRIGPPRLPLLPITHYEREVIRPILESLSLSPK